MEISTSKISGRNIKPVESHSSERESVSGGTAIANVQNVVQDYITKKGPHIISGVTSLIRQRPVMVIFAVGSVIAAFWMMGRRKR